MVARAANLCGLSRQMGDTAVRDMLAQFTDYRTCAAWAAPSLALCYDTGILSQNDLEIRPLESATRAEIAAMTAGLLEAAQLLTGE